MSFWLTILLSASVTSIAAIGLFLQIRSGQFNVGMAPFVGLGGYVSGALCVHLGLAPLFTIPIAILVGFLFGCLFSAATLRLHHWFFAVTTLTFSVASVSLVGMIDIFGGAIGLHGIPFVTDPFIIVAALFGALALAIWIERSRVGLAIRATGDDEELSGLFGVKVKKLRILIFGIGTALAALAGALHAHRFGVTQPTDMDFHHSMLLLVYVIVGGKRNVFGPILGTFFLFTMPEIIKISPEAEMIVYGALMLIVAVWLPDGLVGGIAKLYHYLAGWRGGQAKPQPSSAVP